MATDKSDSFVFINVTHPDELKDEGFIYYVRHTAMTHSGKKRAKKPKKGKWKVVFELEETSASPQQHLMLSRVGLETVDPFTSSPFNMDAYASGLCINFMRCHDGYSHAFQAACAFVCFQNDTTFQLVLSNAALQLHKLSLGDISVGHTEESLRLHNKALVLMHEQLGKPEQHTSDAVVASIIGFMAFDDTAGDYTGWNLHMAGLLKIIALRKQSDIVISEQLHLSLSWADICGSFAQDLAPHFPLPATYLPALRPPPTPITPSAIRQAWASELPESGRWIEIYDLLRHFKDSGTHPNVWIDPIIHSLLSLRPLQFDMPLSRGLVIEAVCRAGALLFLSPVYRSFSNHLVRTSTLRQNLLTLLNVHMVKWGGLRALLLWTLAHAAREAEGVERMDFLTRLAIIMSNTGLTTWEELVEQLKGVLWIEEFESSWKVVKGELENFIQSCSGNTPEFCAPNMY